jgi:hypothetical protein
LQRFGVDWLHLRDLTVLGLPAAHLIDAPQLGLADAVASRRLERLPQETVNDPLGTPEERLVVNRVQLLQPLILFGPSPGASLERVVGDPAVLSVGQPQVGAQFGKVPLECRHHLVGEGDGRRGGGRTIRRLICGERYAKREKDPERLDHDPMIEVTEGFEKDRAGSHPPYPPETHPPKRSGMSGVLSA